MKPSYITTTRLSFAIAAMLASHSAMAADLTWSGGGIDANWLTAANWEGVAPVANDSLFFAGSTQLGPVNNATSGTQFNGITFNSGAAAFTLSGNAINLGGNISNNSTANQTVNLNLALLGATNFNATSGNLTLGGALSGPGALTKSGSGTLNLSGTNTYAGTTTISAGTLDLGSTGAINSGAAVNHDGGILNMSGTASINSSGYTNKNGTLNVSGSAVLVATQLTVASGGTGIINQSGGIVRIPNRDLFFLAGSSGSNGTYNLSGGELQTNTFVSTATGATGVFNFSGGTIRPYNNGMGINVALTLTGSNGVINNTDTFGAGRTLNVSAPIGESGGSQSLTFTGSGNTNLQRANTFTGGLIINSGIVRVADAGALNSTTPNAVSFGAGSSGSLRLNGYSVVISNLSSHATAGTPIVSNQSANAGFLTIGNASNLSGTFAGVIENAAGGGALSLTKAGTGTLTLTGNNTFTGALGVNAGTLAIGTINNASTNGVLGNSASAVTLGSSGTTGTLAFTGSTASSTKPFTLAASGTGAFRVDSAGTNLTLSGAMGGSGNLTKTGDGTLTLSSASNSYAGTTTVSGGTLTMGSAGALGSTSALTVDGGTLNMGSHNLSVGNLTGAGGTISGTTGNRTLTIGQGNTTGGNFHGAIANGTGGSTALTKTGTGAITLSGANTYGGDTNVNDGTLIINGSTSSTSLVIVASAATLGGSGSVGGATTISGTHNPGNSPGIQTFESNLSYSGGTSVVNWELTGNTSTNAANPNAIFDQIIVGGNLVFTDLTTLHLIFNAGGNVLWSDSFWNTDQSWTLYDVAGTTTGFNKLALTSINWLDSGSNAFETIRPNGSFSLSLSGNDVMVNYAIPEPRGASLLAIGVMVLLRRRRD
jgi:autotransporter-associated beta strand protein